MKFAGFVCEANAVNASKYLFTRTTVWIEPMWLPASARFKLHGGKPCVAQRMAKLTLSDTYFKHYQEGGCCGQRGTVRPIEGSRPAMFVISLGCCHRCRFTTYPDHSVVKQMGWQFLRAQLLRWRKYRLKNETLAVRFVQRKEGTVLQKRVRYSRHSTQHVRAPSHSVKYTHDIFCRQNGTLK